MSTNEVVVARIRHACPAGARARDCVFGPITFAGNEDDILDWVFPLGKMPVWNVHGYECAEVKESISPALSQVQQHCDDSRIRRITVITVSSLLYDLAVWQAGGRWEYLSRSFILQKGQEMNTAEGAPIARCSTSGWAVLQ